jgi:hypothetical protein
MLKFAFKDVSTKNREPTFWTILFIVVSDDVGHLSMLASVELKKRENRDDLDFLQMNGYVPWRAI